MYIIIWNCGYVGLFNEKNYEQECNITENELVQELRRSNINELKVITHERLNDLRQQHGILPKPMFF